MANAPNAANGISDIDALVLGCTHYPLLGDVIHRVAARLGGDGLQVVDSAHATAQELASILADRGMTNADSEAGTLRLLVTDRPGRFADVASRFLGCPPPKADRLFERKRAGLGGQRVLAGEVTVEAALRQTRGFHHVADADRFDAARAEQAACDLHNPGPVGIGLLAAGSTHNGSVKLDVDYPLFQNRCQRKSNQAGREPRAWMTAMEAALETAVDNEVSYFLDDLHVGQRFTSGRYRVDADQIKRFAREFDPQPFHLEEEAGAHSVFGGLAASGWHTAAMTMRLLAKGGLPLAGGIIGAGGDITWPQPTRPGDELHVVSEVKEIIPSRSRPDRGIVVMRSETRNQRDEVLQVVTARLIVPRRA